MLTMRVEGDTGYTFTDPSRYHKLEKVGGRAIFRVHLTTKYEFSEFLVDDETEHRIRNAEVGGGQAAVETPYAILAVHVLYAPPYCQLAHTFAVTDRPILHKWLDIS